MNVYDTVQAKASEIAGLISLTLGLCLISASCWLLHQTISSESLVYYSYGLQIGGLRIESEKHLEAYDLLSTRMYPYVTVIKLSASLAIIGGLVQVGSCLLTYKTTKQSLRIWLGMTVISLLLSLATLILPVAYRLTHSIESKILITIASLNALMLAHLFGVVYIQFRRLALEEASSSSSPETESKAVENTSTVSTNPSSLGNAQALAGNVDTGNKNNNPSTSGRSTGAAV